MSDRHEMQAAGTHPAPCARHCESTAYEIEIRRLRAELAASREREARMRDALDKIAWGRAPGPLNNRLAQQYEQIAVAALAEGSPQ